MAQNVVCEPGVRKHTNLYHINNGYYFYKKYQHHETVFLKCVRAGISCRGRASYDPTKGFLMIGQHNHGPDPHYGDEMALRRNIHARCANNIGNESFKSLLNEESLMFAPEVAERFSYAKMRTQMRGLRAAEMPDLTAILQEPQDGN